MSDKTKKGSDLQGVTRLVTDATIGVTELVEAMHRRVVHPPLLPSTPIQHLITSIAGITYRNVKWSTRFIGGGLDKVLGLLAPKLGDIKNTDEMEGIRAALNGVVGDYLEEKENPLEIKMQFRYQSQAIPLDSESIGNIYPKVNGKVLIMVHGSSMNDIQWTRNEHNHGAALAEELDLTPMYLHYNSGRHISTNGQGLDELLEQLVQQWPVPIEELVIVAHSMGGLVTRSALHYGQQEAHTWTAKVKKIVFLGTPHHGALLERAGNYLDVVLESIPYAKPFARLGKIRSAGVTDLRYGNLVDEDWQGSDRFDMDGDQRRHIPLPKQVACHSIAAVNGKETKSRSSRIIGDRLVGVKSALGQHSNPDKTLQFEEANTCLVYEHTHMDLLSSLDVYEQIKDWIVR